MSVQLPFELLASIGEHVHLSCDQFVEFGAVDPSEVSIPDAPAVPEAEVAHQRPVAFNAETFRRWVWDVGAQLGIVESEQICRIEVLHGGRTLRAPRDQLTR